jgi:hypothetical protein
MSHRATGTAFCAIAGLLYGLRYIVAVLYAQGTNFNEYSSDIFQRWMNYVGSDLWNWAALALVVGIVYLALAEWQTWRTSRSA